MGMFLTAVRPPSFPADAVIHGLGSMYIKLINTTQCDTKITQTKIICFFKGGRISKKTNSSISDSSSHQPSICYAFGTDLYEDDQELLRVLCLWFVDGQDSHHGKCGNFFFQEQKQGALLFAIPPCPAPPLECSWQGVEYLNSEKMLYDLEFSLKCMV